MSKPPIPERGFDALLPQEMAVKAETLGEIKARLDAVTTFVLALLAGSFIGLGANFATVATAGTSEVWPYGATRVLVGVAFSLGLILVVVGGAELFTGNTLIVMAWASGRVRTAALLRNWAIVYVGNFAGAVATAGMVYLSGQHRFGTFAVGRTALEIATAKVQLDFHEALFLGVLCNLLVCLAVWLTYSCRTTADRILAIVPPISAFVAAGFEHSVANMYFVPLGLFLKHSALEEFASASPPLVELTWSAFMFHNLLPVTIGNLIGGAVFVGGVYYFVYLRRRAAGRNLGN